MQSEITEKQSMEVVEVKDGLVTFVLPDEYEGVKGEVTVHVDDLMGDSVRQSLGKHHFLPDPVRIEGVGKRWVPYTPIECY